MTVVLSPLGVPLTEGASGWVAAEGRPLPLRVWLRAELRDKDYATVERLGFRRLLLDGTEEVANGP